MEAPSWVELVERNVASFGDIVAGIDPSLSDIPEFFGHDSAWIDRFVSFVIESIEGRVGFVKFQSAYFEACGLAGLAALAAGIRKVGQRASVSFSTPNAGTSARRLPPMPAPT
jgi:orotidine-5'-phosphate decarboxylase